MNRQDSGRWRAGASRPELAIVWISLYGLFLELLLIRWVSTEIRIFAYLQNTILVVCFLGLGAGLFTAEKPVSVRRILWPVAGLAALLALPFTRTLLHGISEQLSVLGDLNIWNQRVADGPAGTVANLALGLALTFTVMALVVEPFVPVGRLLGRLLNEHPRPIYAYSLNVAGSLAGIWAFVVLSYLQLPPVAWFALLAALSLPFLASKARRRADLALLGAIVVLAGIGGNVDGALKTVWSPYQKLALFEESRPDDLAKRFSIQVNNVGYQLMHDLRPEMLVSTPKTFPRELFGATQYDLPFLIRPGASSALILGAGGGNDAAGALRHGVHHVTAVEIDPAIVRFGRDYHPERPYESAQVRVVTNDARSFLATTEESFDVIAFGLLDSHTTTAMTNARLDHYVYTRESIQRASELLSDGGMLFLSFEAQKPFIADRMAAVLQDVFGEPPLAFRVPYTALGWGGVMFVAGDVGAASSNIANDERLAALIARWQERWPVKLSYSTPPATDDWPYVYLDGPKIPLLHVLLAILLGLLFLYVRKLGVPRLDPRSWDRTSWHFFFLGGAFLLLEVQNISKAAVALGNTWLVNAVIISGVLGMVLLANLCAARLPRLPMALVYTALLGSVIGLYWVDLASLAFLPYGVKAVVIGGLVTVPMFFGGVVFVRSFARVERKDLALGANLIGALVGALLEAVSFLAGIKALLLIVAAFYTLALLARPRGRAVATGAKSLRPGLTHLIRRAAL